MKKLFALFTIFLVFGCIGSTPQDALKAAIEKSVKIDNYRLDYIVNMTAENEAITGNITTYKKGHDLRMDGSYDIGIAGEEYSIILRSYTRNNKTSFCVWNESWFCEYVNETGYDFEKLVVLQFVEDINESMAKNALNLSDRALTTSIAGRDCTMISGAIDMSKMNGNGTSNIAECLDWETGFPLLFAMETTTDNQKVRINMVVTALKVNDVNESTFEMPA